MHCSIQSKEIEEIKDGNILQQTSYWAHVKGNQGLEPRAVEYRLTKDLLHPGWDRSRVVHDDMLILIGYVDKDHCYAYVPYGPKDEPVCENHGLFLEELSEVLRPMLPRNCMFIRYDLPWENQWALDDNYYDEMGNWNGPPPERSQEFRVNFNTHNWNLHKSPSDNLPAHTIFLNLVKEPDQLMYEMKSKTRYNVRLSGRKGVRVKEYGPEYLDKWYALYLETAKRNHITQHKKEFFTTVLDSQRITHGNVEIRLLMADYGGQFLAAMFLALSDRRGTYLYGASSRKMKHLMPTYAIQWEAIKIARSQGCREYDMFGVSPSPIPSHPMYGLYRFKRGFGGRLFHRMGCWDYPLITKEYEIFRAQEVQAEGYHRS